MTWHYEYTHEIRRALYSSWRYWIQEQMKATFSLECNLIIQTSSYSHYPMSAKRSVVTTLSQLIPSTRITKEEEVIFRKVFRSNDYPRRFIREAVYCSQVPPTQDKETPIVFLMYVCYKNMVSKLIWSTLQRMWLHLYWERGLNLSTKINRHRDAVHKAKTEKLAIAEHMKSTV